MPGISSTPSTTMLAPLPEALTPSAVEECTKSYAAAYLTSTLLTLAAHLIDLTTNSLLFGKPSAPDAFSPTLATLFTRLQAGQYGPSYLPSELLQPFHVEARVHQRYDGTVASRPLADFEDLYYAVLATIKEIAGYLNDYVRSGFHLPSASISEGGDTILDLHRGLAAYWVLLNSPACGKTLDDAVRQARFDALRDEVQARVANLDITQEDGEAQLAGLWALRAANDVDGIVFIGGWAPGMINTVLQQRYRQTMAFEKALADDVVAAEARTQMMQAVPKVTKKPKKVHKKTLSRLEGIRRSNSSRRASERGHGRHVRSAIALMSREAKSQVEAPLAGSVAPLFDGPIPKDDSEETKQWHINLDRKLRGLQGLTDDRLSETRRQMDLEWDMRRLRVDEYQTHLRERVAQDSKIEN